MGWSSTRAALCPRTRRYMVGCRTLWLIVLQGVFGGVPWVALGGFMVLFLQSSGFSDAQACLAPT